MTPQEALARVDEHLVVLRRQSRTFGAAQYIATAEALRDALVAINARLEQHFVGAQYDHPEVVIKGGKELGEY